MSLATYEVLEHGCEVDRRSRPDSLRVVALLEKSVDSTDGELQTQRLEWVSDCSLRRRVRTKMSS